MAEWDGGAVPGARTVASVKRYDATRGFGFLSPVAGGPDIFCHASAMREVGLDTLLVGATVTCDVIQRDGSPRVVRIHAVDFSTATAGEGRMRGNPIPAGAGPAFGRQIRALVKWFAPTKGYGFLEAADGSGDVFCHASAVAAAGRDALPQGAVVTCEIVQGDKGPQVSRIVAVDADSAAGNSGRRHFPPAPAWSDGGSAAAAMGVRGTVKFYNPARGFGFVVPDDGGREVFVHGSALSRSGLDDLQPGQRVSMRVEEAPRGLQATEVEPLRG